MTPTKVRQGLSDDDDANSPGIGDLRERSADWTTCVIRLSDVRWQSMRLLFLGQSLIANGLGPFDEFVSVDFLRRFKRK